MTGHKYELVFEGMIEPSAEMERSIKLVLMADCSMSFEQASEIFQQTPAVLATADNDKDLAPLRTLLRQAGAQLSVRCLHQARRPAPIIENFKGSMREFVANEEGRPLQVNDKQLDEFLTHLQSNKRIDIKRYRIVDGMRDDIVK